MTFLKQLVKKLHWLEDAILVVIFISLIGLAFSQIALRNFFGGGWLWADSALRILVLWLALWGASIAGRNGHHIRVELASHYFPPSWQHALLIICDFACALITGFIAYHSALFVWSEYHYGGIAFLNIPVWFCELIIPLSFILLALRFFVQSIATALRVEPDIRENLK